MKKPLLGMVTVSLSLILFLTVGEALTRTWLAWGKYLGGTMVQTIEQDPRLGWRAIPDLRFRAERKDAGGASYYVDYATDSQGFRLFGNPRTSRQKIFVVGDSFTQAVEVSNDKTYYSLLKDTLDCEVFAYGASGYGTLQDYMILDRYVDLIRPQMIVIQACSNDFVNNHLELEKASRRNNNGLRRPYLRPDGSIILAIPTNTLGWLREFANDHSRFLYFILSRWDRLRSNVPSVEELIQKRQGNYPLFQEAVALTDGIFSLIRKRIPPGTPVYIFSADSQEPFHGQLKNIVEKHGFNYIPGIARGIEDAQQKGQIAKAADRAHWNEVGHAVAARILAEGLRPSPAGTNSGT